MALSFRRSGGVGFVVAVAASTVVASVVFGLWGLAKREQRIRYADAVIAITQDDPDYTAAVPVFRRLAEQGYAPAQARLGYMLLKGIGVPQNPAEAVRWLAEADRQGEIAGSFNLGIAYWLGVGVKADAQEALALFRKAYDGGIVRAAFLIGAVYDLAPPPVRDDAAALTWLSRAADMNLPEAYLLLGEMYREGRGVPADPKTASRWFERAARAGRPAGQVQYGSALYDGDGVARDTAEGIAWIAKAARNGDGVALYTLAVIQSNGGDVGMTPADLAALAEASAAEYDPGAFMALAHANLSSPDGDRTMGYAFLSLAADWGDGGDADTMGGYQRPQSPEEKAAVAKAKAAWEKAHPKPRTPPAPSGAWSPAE